MGEVDLVRALAIAGIRSAVFIEPGNLARFSRSTVHAVDWVDTWREPQGAVGRLLEFGGAQPEPPVLFYDADWDLLIVSRYRDRLRAAFRFVVPERALVEQLVDKAKFQALAERHHLPVPAGYRLPAGGAPPDVELRFPVVVKPLTRHHANWRPLTRAKAIRVNSERELRECADSLAPAGIDALVQEEVLGPESRIVSYHVYVDENGHSAAEFTGRKVRTFPAGYGYSTALEITDDAETAALGQEVVRRLDLRGVAKVDFKRDDQGQLRLLEINPRFNLWHHPAAVAGVNLPALVYADLVGIPRPRVSRNRAPVHWCSPAHDLRAAREQGVSVWSWVAWAAHCEAKSGFSLSDPLPVPRAALWRVGQRLRSAARREQAAERDAAPASSPRA